MNVYVHMNHDNKLLLLVNFLIRFQCRKQATTSGGGPSSCHMHPILAHFYCIKSVDSVKLFTNIFTCNSLANILN